MEDTELASAMRKVVEKHAIREVLWQYAQGIDARDFGRVAACFTTHARARYSGIDVGGSRDAIVEHLKNVGRFAATTHLFTNISVRVDGDGAFAHSTALSFLVDRREGEGTVYMRGIQYFDDFQRTHSGWAIENRVHQLDWMSTMDDVPGGPMW